MPARSTTTCLECGKKSHGQANRLYCSERCRKRAQRAREKAAEAARLAMAMVEPPTPPEDLSEAASAVWANVFTSVPVDVDADREVVRRYAELVDRRAQFLATLGREGWTSIGSAGQEVPHPLAKMVEAIEGRLLAIEGELGLTPKARQRMGYEEAA